MVTDKDKSGGMIVARNQHDRACILTSNGGRLRPMNTQDTIESPTAPRYRVDVSVHNLLMAGTRQHSLLPDGREQKLPEAQFPRFPDLAGDVEPDAKYLPRDGNPYRKRVTPFMVRRALRGWLYPYVRSRVMPGEFHRSSP